MRVYMTIPAMHFAEEVMAVSISPQLNQLPTFQL